MCREIKFRAWYESGEEKQMFYVGDRFGTKHPFDCCKYAMEGQPVKLMQFTGLKDPKGVEVYEKDIVKLEGGQLVVVDLTPKKAIEYGHGDCAFSIHLPIIYGYGTGGDFEVIGNIYENPELLEKAK